MKLKEYKIDHKTNINKKESVTIGIGDVGVVCKILRMLYKYPIRTLVQEYLCNARDAYREIKQTKPIDIYLPTPSKPILEIRDYGKGMSPEDITNIFSSMTTSTKRGSNELTGGFGIGSKSYFIYGQDFYLRTIHKGIAYSYLVTIQEKEEGEITLLTKPSKTSEPDGTSVQLPVKHNDEKEFSNSVLRACYFWKDKYKIHGLINEEEKESLVEKVYSDKIKIYKKSEFLSSYFKKTVVFLNDGIPYEVENSLSEISKYYPEMNATHMVFDLNVGEISVNVDRENLDYSEENVNKIKKYLVELNSLMQGDVLSIFNNFRERINEIDFYSNTGIKNVLDRINYEDGLKEVKLDGNFDKSSNYNRVIFYKPDDISMSLKIKLYYKTRLEKEEDIVNNRIYLYAIMGSDKIILQYFLCSEKTARFKNKIINTYCNISRNVHNYFMFVDEKYKDVLDKNGVSYIDARNFKIEKKQREKTYLLERSEDKVYAIKYHKIDFDEMLKGGKASEVSKLDKTIFVHKQNLSEEEKVFCYYLNKFYKYDFYFLSEKRFEEENKKHNSLISFNDIWNKKLPLNEEFITDYLKLYLNDEKVVKAENKRRFLINLHNLENYLDKEKSSINKELTKLMQYAVDTSNIKYHTVIMRQVLKLVDLEKCDGFINKHILLKDKSKLSKLKQDVLKNLDELYNKYPLIPVLSLLEGYEKDIVFYLK